MTSNQAIDGITGCSRLTKTKKRYLGISSGYTNPSDSVYVIFGGRVPLVFRGHSDSWEFVVSATSMAPWAVRHLRNPMQRLRDLNSLEKNFNEILILKRLDSGRWNWSLDTSI